MGIGVDHLIGVAESLAILINVVVQVAKGRLLAILDLVSIIRKIGSFDLVAIKAEILDCDTAERGAIEIAFDNALSLDDKDLQTKIADSADALLEVIDIVTQVVSLIDKIKKIIGA